MNVTTFRKLARSYLINEDSVFVNRNDDIADDEHFEMLYGHARTMVTPILPIWKSLVEQSVRHWPSHSLYATVGHAKMYPDELSEGRHDKFFAHITNGTSWESVSDDEYDGDDYGCVLDPRFQGMLLGINSIMPEESVPYSSDYPSRKKIARKLLKNHPIEKLLDDDELAIAFYSADGHEWAKLRSIGIKWMRVWYAARAIQRAYKERLRLKRSRMIQLVLVPIIVRNK
jgi:hypothetical protein